VDNIYRLSIVPVMLIALLVGISHTTVMAEQVTITVCSWSEEYVQHLVDAFNASQSEIKAQVELKWRDAIKTSLIAGTGPDVIMYHMLWFDEEWEPFWVDLTRIVEETDASDWIPGIWDAIRSLNPNFYGQIRRALLSVYVGLTFYDKNHFTEAGLAEPAEMYKNGMWTWNSMLEVARKLTLDTDGDGNVDRWAIAEDLSKDWLRSFVGAEVYALQNGGYILSADGRYTANQPEFVEAIQYWADLYLVHNVQGSPRVGGNALPDQTASMYNYPSQYSAIYDRANYRRWDAAPIPYPSDPRPIHYVVDQGSFVVNANSDNVDAGLEFIRFLLSPEGISVNARKTGFPPTRLSVLREEYLPSLQSQYPYTDYFTYSLQTLINTGFRDTPPGPYYVPRWPEIVRILQQSVREVLNGEKSARTALDEAAGPVNTILRDVRDRIITRD